MLTLGPTREYFDKARFWSNPSTGLMGACLAVSAALRGAQVTAIHGPIALKLPSMIQAVPVVSARDMFAAANDIFLRRISAASLRQWPISAPRL